MSWIDERLFGWSRSARRGTSAWSGPPADDSSRVGTPDYSDEEDTGDYDNVIGAIPMNEDSTCSQKSRSRQSSYADLQRLRMAPLTSHYTMEPSSQTNGKSLLVPHDESLRHRSGHKPREENSSGSSLPRTATVNPDNTFARPR